MEADIVSNNKVVYITYTILDQAGNVFEQSDVPMGYVHGVEGPLFEKIEQALDGSLIGDRVEVLLTPDDGFGPHREDLTFTDDIENVPEQYRHIGAEVSFKSEKGEVMDFIVTHMGDGKLTIDANHPLAGQTVTFVVTVTGIREATQEEKETAIPAEMAEQFA